MSILTPEREARRAALEAKLAGSLDRDGVNPLPGARDRVDAIRAALAAMDGADAIQRQIDEAHENLAAIAGQARDQAHNTEGETP